MNQFNQLLVVIISAVAAVVVFVVVIVVVVAGVILLSIQMIMATLWIVVIVNFDVLLNDLVLIL